MNTSTTSNTSNTSTTRASALLCRMLGLAEVVYMTTFSKATVYRKMAADEFPQPVRLSTRRVAWRESDIVAWLDQQQARAAA